jgi:RHS repeat-associated protein
MPLSAQTYVPSVKIGTAALIAPSSADYFYGTATTSTNDLAGSVRPPEIVALARALKGDPDLIYQYVRNTIDTEWEYGLQKGALGASIDHSGTSFDQAMLMVELLRQSGLVANYESGTITLTGAQFQAWTNITNAQAACQLLSSGGFPALVNGMTNTNCAGTFSGMTVTSVQMAHVWVSVNIGGTFYLYDPSYKPYTWVTGINLNAATGFTSGAALTAATTGMDTGTASGLTYAHNLNTSSLYSLIQGYATSLLSYLRGNSMSGAQLEDLTGGGVIQPAAMAQLRQTVLPYSSTVLHEWSGNVPNQYRCTLYVHGEMENVNTLLIEVLFSHTFYVDEIYGRRLGVWTNFIGNTNNYAPYLNFTSNLTLDGQVVDTAHTMARVTPDQHYPVSLTITANHPYAAASNGTATTDGTYMDATIYKSAGLVNPITIVNGWGDTSADLLAKWSGELQTDSPDPPRLDPAPCPGEDCPPQPIYEASSGDYTRDKLAANFLAQYTRAAHLHANIANGIETTHHVIGVVYADDYVDDDAANRYDGTEPDYFVTDSCTRIDVDTGLSFVNRAADATKRRAALLSIAATSAALEASVISQTADLPDVSSTATRFEWGNAPPTAEDPSGAGPRRFFSLPAATSVPANWVLWEHSTTVPADEPATTTGDPEAWAPSEMSALQNDINTYTAAGFSVVASQESFLGPGQRGGYVKVLTDYHTHLNSFDPSYTKQRGGAFIATKYDANGDPLEIAHDVVGVLAPDSYGVTRPAKGGGGGIEPNVAAVYSPPDPGDVLKAKFIDRSNMLGVDLGNGSMSQESPANIEVGTGGFPYSLSVGFSWHQGAPNFNLYGPIVPEGPTGWVSSWYNDLALSSSGMEGMGSSDIRASAATIAAFMAEQDLFSGTPSAPRDVAATLTQAYLTHQYQGNSITVTVGGSSKQFVRLVDNSWIAPGGSYGTVTQTGTRAPFTMVCERQADEPHFALSRGWDNSGLTFTVNDGHGSQQHFGYWLFHATNDAGMTSFCDRATGFRLNSWTFPSGVSVALTYAHDTLMFDGTRSSSPNAAVSYPSSTDVASVANSLGRTLTFGTDPTSGAPTVTDGSRTLIGLQQLAQNGTFATTDPAGAVTSFVQHYGPAVSPTTRPIPYAQLTQVYTADNASAPNLEYDYDGTGAVIQVKDGNDLQIGGFTAASSGGRDPWTFYIAPGWRGERDDPLFGHDLTDKGFVVVHDRTSIASPYVTGGTSYQRRSRYLDEIGRETDALMDGRGRAVRYTYPESDTEALSYDERDNPLSLTKTPKPGSADATASRTLTAQVSYPEGPTVWTCSNIITCNKPATQTDTKGAVTTIAWDSTSGLLTSVILPAPTGVNRPETDYAYGSFGAAGFKLLTTTTQKTGASSGTMGTTVTAYAYNSANDYVPQSAAVDSAGLNLVTTYTFDATGNPTHVDGPRSDVTDVQDFTWDADRREVFGIEADPDGSGPHPRPAFKTTYDPEGHVVALDTGTTTSATGSDFVSTLTVSTAYDPVGNKIKETTPTRITQLSYDGANRALCTALRMNRNADGSFGTEPADACALSTATAFGPDRIVKTVTDAAGQALQEIRAYGTPIQETYATNTYTPNGKLASVYDADGATHVTRYAYGGFDELLITTFADATTEQLATFSGTTPCSANLQPCSKTNRSGQTIAYTYDPLNRLTGKVDPAAGTIPANTITTVYDLQNRVTNVSDTYGNTLAMVYDAIGRKTSQTDTSPTLSAKTVSYQYDAAGNRTRLTWPDGYYAAYGYDAVNHPTTVIDSSGTTLATYGYDNLARRAALQFSGTTGAKMLYSWSAENDLLTLSNDLAGTANDAGYTHTFTPAHQWATSSISNAAFKYTPPTGTATAYGGANSLNQVSTIGGTAMAYDTRGNLTTDGTTGTTYLYDAENRMMSATRSGATSTYAYDPLGRRTAKTVSASTTNFVYDGDAGIADYGGGTLARRFVPGPDIDNYIATVSSSGAIKFYHTDKMGSIVAMSDVNGNLAEGPYVYDAYGNCFSAGAACSAGVGFRYTGQRLDPETGLYYYRARYYQPGIGQFLQTDPVGYKDNLNDYMYVHDDPTDGTDPKGLMCTGAGDSSKCTLDKYDGKKITKEMRDQHPEWVKFEAKLTFEYKLLQAAAQNGQSVTVQGNAQLRILPTTISAKSLLSRSQVATIGAGSFALVYPDVSSGKLVNREAIAEESDRFSNEIQFDPIAFDIAGKNTSRSFQQIGEAFIHELLHLDPRTTPWDNHPIEHQDPFNNAADQIVGPAPNN